MEKGQHILIDKMIMDKIIECSSISKKDYILEIGSGPGNLTKELAERAHEVTSFEVDASFKGKLIALANKYKNLNLIIGDAIKPYWKGYDKLIANIPYYLSESVIIKSIRADIPFLVLLIGERFKEKLLSDEKIGLIASCIYNIEVIAQVPSKSFDPPPRVNSYIVRLKKKNNVSKIDKIMLDISLSKGKVKNAILNALLDNGKTKNQAREIISCLGIHQHILDKPASKMTSRLFIKLRKGLSDFV